MNSDLAVTSEKQRLEALASYDILDSPSEKDFDDISRLASAICNAPIAMVTLIDENRQWHKTIHGADFKEAPRDFSFCAQAIDTPHRITIIKDTTKDVRFAANPFVTGDQHIRFYAGVPLVNEDGYALGTLCVVDVLERDLSEMQVQALQVLAQQVMDKIELRRKVKNLEETNTALVKSNVLIQKFASMAAHDIKNPLSSMLLSSSVLRSKLAKESYEGCAKLVDVNISSTKSLISLVDEMLAYSKTPSLLFSRKQQFDLHTALNRIIVLLAVPTNIKIILPQENARMDLSFVAFEQIFINLLSNAIRYNDKKQGLITIRFSDDPDFYEFEVEDNGIGIPVQFHEQIFQNNFTLNIQNPQKDKGNGIGLSTVKELILALGGSISVKSEVSTGTTFYVSIKKLLKKS
jgi:signal transduction histidine kinase